MKCLLTILFIAGICGVGMLSTFFIENETYVYSGIIFFVICFFIASFLACKNK